MKSLEGERILITGASGFIGKHLVRELSNRGARLICLSRLDCPPEDIATLVQDWVTVDLSIPGCLENIKKRVFGCKYLFHLSGTVKDTQDISELYNTYFSDIINPIELVSALKSSLRHICLYSTTAVYSHIQKPVDEDSPIEPSGLYGANKYALELLFQLLSKQANIPLCIMRISSVYGFGMPESRAIIRFIRNMLNDCQPCVNGSPYALRDYLYVDDLIEISIQAADCRVGGIFNVASGDPHGLQGVLKIIADILDKPLDTTYIGERKSDDFIINISKAVSVLGFRPRPLSEGLMLLCGFMQ